MSTPSTGSSASNPIDVDRVFLHSVFEPTSAVARQGLGRSSTTELSVAQGMIMMSSMHDDHEQVMDSIEVGAGHSSPWQALRPASISPLTGHLPSSYSASIVNLFTTPEHSLSQESATGTVVRHEDTETADSIEIAKSPVPLLRTPRAPSFSPITDTVSSPASTLTDPNSIVTSNFQDSPYSWTPDGRLEGSSRVSTDDELSEAPSWADPNPEKLWWQLRKQFGPEWRNADRPPSGHQTAQLLQLNQQRDIEWRDDWEKRTATDLLRVKCTIVQVVGMEPDRPCNRCAAGRGPFKDCIILGPNASRELRDRFPCCASCTWATSGSKKKCSLYMTAPKRANEDADEPAPKRLRQEGCEELDSDAILYETPKKMSQSKLNHAGLITPSSSGLGALATPSSQVQVSQTFPETPTSPCEARLKKRPAKATQRQQVVAPVPLSLASLPLPMVSARNALDNPGTPASLDSRTSVSMFKLVPDKSQSLRLYPSASRTHQVGIIFDGNVTLYTGPVSAEANVHPLCSGQFFNVIPGHTAVLTNTGFFDAHFSVVAVDL